VNSSNRPSPGPVRPLAQPDLPHPVFLAVCLAALAAGAVVRLLPCFGDFWLDEIWSIFAVREIDSVLGVFTRLRNSNNHHLYSLLIALIGDPAQAAWYRIPSALAGLGSIVLAIRILSREGRYEAAIGAILTSASFMLIQFSSEARGYSLVVFFSLAAYLLFLEDRQRPRVWTALLFGVSVILGVLSQLIYIFFYLGLAAWHLGALGRRPAAGRRLPLIPQFARLHLLPALGILLLYLVDLRKMEVGGGDHVPLNELLAATVGFTAGLPVRGAPGWLYAAAAAAVLTLGLVDMARRDRPRIWLYAIAVVAAPVAILAITRPVVISPRYFVVGAALWLLLAARLLAAMVRAGGYRRTAALLLVALFLAGNALHAAAFLRLGRGGYRNALRYISAHTGGEQVVCGFDHDFRTGLVVRFYADQIAPKTLLYHPIGQWPREGTEWIIVHAATRPDEPRATLTDGHGNPFRLEAEFDYAGMSGFYWGVYHNLSYVSGGHGPPAPDPVPR